MSEPFVGEIRMFAGNFAPRGWAYCDGQLLAVSQHDALFSLLGTMYGGDGRTTFGLPDMRGRLPIHAGTGPGLNNRRLGAKGGAEEVMLSPNTLPSHRHDVLASTDAADDTDPAGNSTGTAANSNIYGAGAQINMHGDAVTSHAGGGQSHDNVQPFLCIHFIIALVGIYPSRS